MRRIYGALVLLVTACSGGGFETNETAPDPLATSDLSILDVGGTLTTKTVSHLPVLFYHDDFGTQIVTPARLSVDGSIAAGERRESYDICVASLPIFGCILVETRTITTFDEVELSLTSKGGDVDIAVRFTENTRQEPAGGETDGFTSYFNNGDPLNVLIFNTAGADGNGFEHATITLWSQAWGEDAAGRAYAWASIIGDVPRRLYNADDGWYYRWSIENSGEVTYTGPVEALHMENSEYSALASGVATITMDFDNVTISGRLSEIASDTNTFHDIILQPGGFPDTSSDRLVLSGAAISDLSDTSITAPDLTGEYAAMIYGNGTEVGGTFTVGSDREALVGGFLGKEP